MLFPLAKFAFSILAAIIGLYVLFAQRDVALGMAMLALGMATLSSARLDLVEDRLKEQKREEKRG